MLLIFRQVWSNAIGCILSYTILIFKGLSFGAMIFIDRQLYPPNHSQKLFCIFLIGLMLVNYIQSLISIPLLFGTKNGQNCFTCNLPQHMCSLKFFEQCTLKSVFILCVDILLWLQESCRISQ